MAGHTPASAGSAGAAEERWRRLLAPYYAELDLDVDLPGPHADRLPFDAERCELVEELRPAVVSFHFGLPNAHPLDRVRATGARVLLSSANHRR